MANPLTTARNKYTENKKNSTVFTPVGVAQFLYDILKVNGSTYPPYRTVFDPAIGTGRLTEPWYESGHRIIGCDIIRTDGLCVHNFYRGPFEALESVERPKLVLCNSPFNGASGKRLYPEVFLEHIFKLFGPTIPVVLFVPMGMLLNQRKKSKRWRWLRDCGAEITSVISLPLDIFDAVEFHSEILIFNVNGIKPHHFLPEKYL